MEVKDLKPARVWQIFDAITKVPRPSGNLDKIREWLVSFAKENNLECKVDEVGNVAMFRPAAPGFENAKGVVLQGHMDMVAEKLPSSNHNFLTDPIQTRIVDDWVFATDTTLGADDGLGLAIALAALTDPDIKCGALELSLPLTKKPASPVPPTSRPTCSWATICSTSTAKTTA